MATILSGSFVSDGNKYTLKLPTLATWIKVVNMTQAAATTGDCGVEFFWQVGFTEGTSYMLKKSGSSDAVEAKMSTLGFTPVYWGSSPVVGPLQTVSSINSSTPPTVVADCTGLKEGDVVRLVDIQGGQQMSNIDFTVSTITGTQFDLTWAQGIAVTTTGKYRRVIYPPLYKPSMYYIANIVRGSATKVRTTVTHQLTVGQQVRFQSFIGNEMTEINGLIGTITSLSPSDNSFYVDIDSTSFTAFTFPLTTYGSYTPAAVIPIGQDTSVSTTLGDATENDGYMGVILDAGKLGPAGSTSDLIAWTAGFADAII